MDTTPCPATGARPRPGRGGPAVPPGRRPRAAAEPARSGTASARAPRRAGLVALALAAALGACSPGGEDAPTAATLSPTPSPERSGEPLPSPPVPTPDQHSAVGALAEGFPTALLPLPPDAEVLVSSYAPRGEAGGEAGAGQPYDVSLNVRTALPVDEVAALYRTALTAAGFVETVGTPTGGLAAESTYSRAAGQELITVGVLDRDDVRTVTVGGRLAATG